ncbi:MAG: ABC transporter ATP-binding protein [Roseiflexaceae bacterium]
MSTDHGETIREPPTIPMLVALGRYRLSAYVLMSIALIFLSYLFNLIPGLVIREVFDALTGQAPAGFNPTTALMLLMLITVVVQSIGVYGFWLEGSLIGWIETLLRRNMLEQIFRRPGAQALPTSSGEAISRFRDDPRAILQFLTYAPDVPAQAVALTISLVILGQIDLLFTLAVFVPLLVTIVAVQVANRSIRSFRQTNQAAIGAVTGVIGEIFAAVQAIKVSGAERHIVQHVEVINEARRKASLRDLLLFQSISSFAQNAANIAIGLLLLLAAQAFRDRGTPLTIGDLALFVTYLTSLAGLIGFFSEIMTRYRQNAVSFQRMLDLMPDQPAMALVAHRSIDLDGPLPMLPNPPARQPLQHLQVEGLRFCYPHSTNGITDIGFSLQRGTLTVITGRIGSGKTTLLRALLGLVQADAGVIRWNGQIVAEPASFFVPPQSAYTPQVPRLLSESLRNNLLQGVQASAADLQQAIELAVFERDLALLDQGLETVIGTRGARLSGGQIQRAAAARMFVRQPELIVCDDLSSALDVATERELWQRVLGRGQTCLAVSHRHPVLRRADQIIVMEQGRIEAIGRAEELLQHSPSFRAIWSGDDAPPVA